MSTTILEREIKLRFNSAAEARADAQTVLQAVIPALLAGVLPLDPAANRAGHQQALARTLAAIDGSALSEPRTKLAAELVSGWRSERPLVLVVAPGEDDLARAFRNLERTHVVEVGHVEAADLVWARSLIVSKSALAIFEGGDAS